MLSGESSTARTAALLASVAVVIGAIGPWETTFIADIAGTQGDGRITLILGIIGGLLVLRRPPGSRWLTLAVVLGIVATFIGVADLINVSGSTQTLFGRQVQLVGVGWGLWLTAIASAAFTCSAFAYKVEVPEAEMAE